MSPHRHQVGRFERLFQEIKRFYDIRKTELENVIIDHELLEEEWTIHFVVDYYQVLTFAFPLGLEQVSSLDDERARSHFAMKQAARAFVFYGLKYTPNPVLIPPYATELRNWLSAVLSRGQESVLRIRAIQNWGMSLLNEEEKELIERANELYELKNEEGQLLSQLTSALITLVNKKFLDMYFLISGAMIEGVMMMRNLYQGEDPRLQMAHRRWANYDKMTKDILKGYSSEWYQLFSKIRIDRTISNINDALAIEIVMALNKYLMKNKEIVYLVSDADTMYQVLNEKIKGKSRGSVLHPETGREIPILRTSDTFLTYMTSVEERLNVESDLRRLYREKRELADFYAIEAMIKRASEKCQEISRTVQEDCSTCPHLELCSEISDKLEQHKEKTNEIEVFRLILNRFGFLEPYLNFLESGEEIEKNIEEIVRFLGGKNEDLEEKIRDKVEKLEQDIDNLIDTVEDPSIDLAPQDAIEFLAYRLKRFNGIPYRIIFKDPRINEAIDSLFDSLGKKDVGRVKKNAKKIFNLTHDPTLGNEGKLLLASLLYCFRHYEMVKDIALQMLSKADVKERREFELLKCLSYSRLSIENHSIFYFDKAHEGCVEAIENYHDDPRFYNMLGVIIARGVESGLEKKKTLEDAMEWFKAGLELCTVTDNMLQASLKNNIAYLMTQKKDHTLDELSYSAKLMREIEELWPRKKWAADFWDTDGCVHLGLAELQDDQIKRKASLKKAKEKEKKAEEIGEKHKIRISDLNLIQKRLDIITKELKKLES